MKTSIIMTSYNYANFIAKAIESVISQSVKDWELIIVDDGSSDNSVDIIKDFCQKDERIKLFSHPDNKNHGLCASTKLGLEKAQSEWVAFLESDDAWSATYLEKKLEYREQNPQCTFIYNAIELVGEEKQIQAKKVYLDRINILWKNNFPKDVFNEFGKENIVPTFSCVMCKKTALLELDFTPSAAACLDYWLWWQYAQDNNFGYIPEPLTIWTIHPESYLSKSLKSYKHQINRAMFISKIIKHFKRKPKLSFYNKILKNPILAFLIYSLIYLKKLLKI